MGECEPGKHLGDHGGATCEVCGKNLLLEDADNWYRDKVVRLTSALAAAESRERALQIAVCEADKLVTAHSMPYGWEDFVRKTEPLLQPWQRRLTSAALAQAPKPEEGRTGEVASPLCVTCGHPATDHAVDDEERRECVGCCWGCTQYVCDAPPTPPPQPEPRLPRGWKEIRDFMRVVGPLPSVLASSEPPPPVPAPLDVEAIRAFAETLPHGSATCYQQTSAARYHLLRLCDETMRLRAEKEAYRLAYQSTDKADIAAGWAAAVLRAENAEARLRAAPPPEEGLTARDLATLDDMLGGPGEWQKHHQQDIAAKLRALAEKARR